MQPSKGPRNCRLVTHGTHSPVTRALLESPMPRDTSAEGEDKPVLGQKLGLETERLSSVEPVGSAQSPQPCRVPIRDPSGMHQASPGCWVGWQEAWH